MASNALVTDSRPPGYFMLSSRITGVVSSRSRADRSRLLA